MKTRFAVVLCLGIGTLALACMPPLEDTVHFNDSVVDFGAPPPPLVVSSSGEDANRPVPHVHGWNEQEETDAATAAALRPKALGLEQREAWADSKAVWEKIAKLNQPGSEEARDRVEVLSHIGAEGPPTGVKAYLVAKSLPESAREIAMKTLLSIADMKDVGWLKAHALYAVASLAYDARDPASGQLYEDAAIDPESPRYEPALIMAGRSYLLGPPYNGRWVENPAPEPVIPPAQIAKAEVVLKRLLDERPQTRFRRSAEGWLARAKLLQGDYPNALAAYLTLVDPNGEPNEQARLVLSIRMTASKLGKTAAREVRGLLLSKPELLEPYLNYRLYHTDAKKADLESLAAFVKQVLDANPGTDLQPGVLARLAEIAYLTDDSKLALSYADQSLAAPSSPTDRRDLAVFVRAGALGKLGKAVEAHEAVSGFEMKFPESYLKTAAIENRALLSEKRGKFGDALTDYTTINYRFDVAYLADARMPLAQLRAYVATHKTPQIVFALAMRLMRLGAFPESKRLLASIPTAERRKMFDVGSADYSWIASLDKIPDPLQTATDLNDLTAKMNKLPVGEAKAEAAYRLASYYYDHRNLILYNPSLWQGARSMAFGWTWNKAIADKSDEAAVSKYHYEHECLAHARAICLAIAARYPKSPIAPKALYRAATSCRRLGNFNPWWRGENERHDYYVEAAGLLRRVYTQYPLSPLAKNAHKYEKVYIEEGAGQRRNALFVTGTVQ